MRGRCMGIRPEDINPVIDERIDVAIENLEEHVAPTLAAYKGFLQRELDWAKQEERKKLELSRSPP